MLLPSVRAGLLATLAIVSLPAAVAAEKPMDLHRFADLEGVVRASFTQHEPGRAVASGQAWLGPGGKLRWQQRAPHEMLLVSNGTTAWQVEPDLDQAMALDPRQATGWAAVLQGRASRDGVRQVRPGIWQGPEDTTVRMGPSGPLEITAGSGVSIRFGPWTPVAKGQAPSFTFSPPAGMDVVGTPGD